MWKVSIPGLWRHLGFDVWHWELPVQPSMNSWGCQGQEPALPPQVDPEEATELLQGLGPSAHGWNRIILKVKQDHPQGSFPAKPGILNSNTTLPLLLR